MPVVGVDYGTVRVGLAISDELGWMAHPRPHLRGGDDRALIAELARLAQAEGVERFVVGWPRRLGGERGPAARRVEHFAEALGEATGVPVTLHDEWLTSKEAQVRLRAGGVSGRAARQKVDSAAAAILLQSYLDARRTGEP